MLQLKQRYIIQDQKTVDEGLWSYILLIVEIVIQFQLQQKLYTVKHRDNLAFCSDIFC